jgi:carboxylesterase type B
MVNKVTIPFGENASIVGISVDEYVNRFTGIPFALPPVGEYRWKHPQRLPADYFSKLSGPYDATEFKDLCLQPPTPIPHTSTQEPTVTSLLK